MSLRIIDLPSISGQTTDTSLPVSLSSSTATTYRMTLAQISAITNGTSTTVSIGNSNSGDLPSGTNNDFDWSSQLWSDPAMGSCWTNSSANLPGTTEPKYRFLVVPAGATRVRLACQVRWDPTYNGNSTAGFRSITFTDGWNHYASSQIQVATDPRNFHSVTSGVINLSAYTLSDGVTHPSYFKVYIDQTSGSNQRLLGGADNYFQMEVLRWA